MLETTVYSDSCISGRALYAIYADILSAVRSPGRSPISTQVSFALSSGAIVLVVFKDGIKTVAQEGLKAYNTASSVISAAGSVYDAVDSTVKGVQGADGIGGIITAGVGAFDNFTTATGAITGAAGTIGTNYTDKEGEKGLGEKVDDFFKGKNKGANEGKEVTQDLGTINGTANGIMDIPNDIKNIFR